MSTLNVSNIAGPSSTGTAATLSSINSGPLAGFRNAIINGNFDIWQRGTSFTASGYSADRHVSGATGTTFTATRQPFTLGQTAVPGEPTYFCRTVVSSVAGASNYSAIVQRIEGVRTFAGQQVTLSFWAKVDATKNIAVSFQQYFGSGGSPSATISDIGVTKVSIGTSWQKVTVTATIPSISGKTIGTDNNDSLDVIIWFDAGSSLNSRTDSLGQQSGTFEIAQVQLEPGTVATPFERRSYGQELALCQRYYEVLGDYLIYSGYAGTGNVYYNPNRFAVRKRAVPNIVTTDVANSSFPAGNPTVGSVSADGFYVQKTANATTSVSYFQYSATASAEL